ncbi:MAG TPA: hypothetical protein VLI45_08890 [Acidobacteriaceae bacterium]|nr:hypothetical protein [Acidobacteriaceae bacterium]
MAERPFTAPVENNIPRVGDVAVGEDLGFQRRWWAFERVIWIIFLAILVLDALGLFGRGWLAKAQWQAPDDSMDVKYERVERTLTSSTMTVHFHPQAVHNGNVQLFVSDSLIRQLGQQRVTPQPVQSIVGHGGVTYVFPAQQMPLSVELALSPKSPWMQHFTIGVPGAQSFSGSIFVMP